jgi:hypothetical protein
MMTAPGSVNRRVLGDAMKASGEGDRVLELVFLVEEAPEGGLTARALGESIFTEAGGVADLYDKVRDAVRCQFDEGQSPRARSP